MQHLPSKRVLVLILGLAIATAGSAYAQDTVETGEAPIDTIEPEAGAIDTAGVDTSAISDTTDTISDTTDTSNVTNPPGYRGMERDTTLFPDDSAAPGASTGGEDTTQVGETDPTMESEPSPRIDPSETTAEDTAGPPVDSAQ
jgi:hypothetical protein